MPSCYCDAIAIALRMALGNVCITVSTSIRTPLSMTFPVPLMISTRFPSWRGWSCTVAMISPHDTNVPGSPSGSDTRNAMEKPVGRRSTL